MSTRDFAAILTLEAPTGNSPLLSFLLDHQGRSIAGLSQDLGIHRDRLIKLGPGTSFGVISELSDRSGLCLDAFRDLISPRSARPEDVREADGAASVVSFEEALEQGKAAVAASDTEGIGRWAERALHAAGDEAEKRANALHLLSVAKEVVGLYAASAALIERALELGSLSVPTELKLEASLAGLHLDQRSVSSALAVAFEVQRKFESYRGPKTLAARTSYAFSFYVAGFAHLIRAGRSSASGASQAHLAIQALRTARKLYRQLAEANPEKSWYRAIAQTCRHGISAAEVEAGLRPAAEFVWASIRRLDDVPDVDVLPHQERETVGRMCAMAAETVLHHLEVRRDLSLGILLGKLMDVAASTNNWTLWERYLSFEFLDRLRESEQAKAKLRWALDKQLRPVLVELMNRFPKFRDVARGIIEADFEARLDGSESEPRRN